MEVYLVIGLLVVVNVFSEATFTEIEQTVINADINQTKAVVCFVTIWSVYRPGRGQFNVEDIEPTLCTHVIFGFLHLNDTDDAMSVSESWTKLLGNKPQIKLSKLKRKNPNLKALVSVGGWLYGSIKFSQLAAKPKRRERFINNAIDFIRENGLDGMDLIWQYPGKRGGSPVDKESYIQLLKELRMAFDRHNFTLTACVGSSKDTIDYSYDVPKLSEYLDYMLLHSFDYYGSWSRKTGANSALKGPNFLNMEYTVKYLLKAGANPDKLLLGVPFFARNFLLNDTKSFDKKAPSFGQQFYGEGFQGPYTAEEGFLAYNEVCLYIKNSSETWDVYWDEESETPMAVSDDKMISFDDERSTFLKAMFGLNSRLGGFFAYTIDYDDFRGDCGQKYPLLQTIREELKRYEIDKDDEIDNSVYVDAASDSVRCNLSYVFSIVLLIVLFLM